MATLKDTLQARIKLQQAEVDRIQSVVKDDLAAAKAKLDVLKQLQSDLNPAFDAFAARLISAHILDVE